MGARSAWSLDLKSYVNFKILAEGKLSILFRPPNEVESRIPVPVQLSSLCLPGARKVAHRSCSCEHKQLHFRIEEVTNQRHTLAA